MSEGIIDDSDSDNNNNVKCPITNVNSNGLFNNN